MKLKTIIIISLFIISSFVFLPRSTDRAKAIILCDTYCDSFNPCEKLNYGECRCEVIPGCDIAEEKLKGSLKRLFDISSLIIIIPSLIFLLFFYKKILKEYFKNDFSSLELLKAITIKYLKWLIWIMILSVIVSLLYYSLDLLNVTLNSLSSYHPPQAIVPLALFFFILILDFTLFLLGILMLLIALRIRKFLLSGISFVIISLLVFELVKIIIVEYIF